MQHSLQALTRRIRLRLHLRRARLNSMADPTRLRRARCPRKSHRSSSRPTNLLHRLTCTPTVLVPHSRRIIPRLCNLLHKRQE